MVGTGYRLSPGIARGSRLVASTRSSPPTWSSDPMTSAVASRRCSQSSNTRRTRRSSRCSATRPENGNARLFLDAEGRGHRLGHQGSIGQAPELHDPRAIEELVHGLHGELERESGLAHPARAGQGQQNGLGQPMARLVELRGTAHEAGQLTWQVVRPVLERAQGGELGRQVGCAAWNRRSGCGEVLQPVVPEVAEHGIGERRSAQQVVGGHREQHLAAVAGRADPGRAVHVHTHQHLVGAQWLPGVDAHPGLEADILRPRMVAQPSLRGQGRGQGSSGRGNEKNKPSPAVSRSDPCSAAAASVTSRR